ncbi:MAG: hypothetical protein WC529_00270 [Candidatus Margulisiibacteriota bacterium]
MKKLVFALISIVAIATFVRAEVSAAEQDYLNKLYYKHNKLELVTKKRLIDEKRHYNYTDISSTTFSFESYSDTTTRITNQGLQRSEVKEINEWYVYLGGISELNDFDFLKLVGDNRELARINELESGKAVWRNLGTACIGGGVIAMLGGAVASAGSGVITTGALVMTGGFFLSAFNLTPDHYIRPEYAQAKIDEYNVALKRKLNLPLTYE